MKLHLALAVLMAASALTACQPAAEWTESEAPKRIGLDTVPSRIDLRFAPGSDRLAPADAKRLHNLAASGAIAPSDRVTVSGGGGSSKVRGPGSSAATARR